MGKRVNEPTAHGQSQRQLRVGELLRRALAEILARGEVHDPDLAGHVLTVTEVRPSPDLRRATVYVVPLGGEGSEEALAALGRLRGEIRRLLNRRVDLKFSPDLSFALDRTFDKLDETRAMFADPKVARDIASED